MSERATGYLVRFDEERRASILREEGNLSYGFSDALSSADWPVRQWEVCGLLFEPGKITHWALARKGRRVATGKVRIEFTEVASTNIRIDHLVASLGSSIKKNIVSSRSGSGGSIPSDTWQSLKNAVGEINSDSLAALERLERLRDQSRDKINRPGVEIVAQQRDAVGLALDAFDQSGNLRKQTLKGWTASKQETLTSFLDGLNGVRTIEDQIIAHDAATFSGAKIKKHTMIGTVFGAGNRKLEVFNINRTDVEHSLGVDLMYFNEEFDAWTLLQYKTMEYSGDAENRVAMFRPDSGFDAELKRMTDFRAQHTDEWGTSSDSTLYRLSGDGFLFKFCPRIQLEVLSDSLLPGMYLPREFVQSILADPSTLGKRGGRIITYENTGRHLTNTLFAELVRDGWIGTRGISSKKISEILHLALNDNKAMVLARARPTRAAANLPETLSSLGIEPLESMSGSNT